MCPHSQLLSFDWCIMSFSNTAGCYKLYSSIYCTNIILLGISRIFDFFTILLSTICVTLSLPDIKRNLSLSSDGEGTAGLLLPCHGWPDPLHVLVDLFFSLCVEISYMCCIVIPSAVNILNILLKSETCFLILGIQPLVVNNFTVQCGSIE